MTRSIALLILVASAGAIGTAYYVLEERNEVNTGQADRHQNEIPSESNSDSKEDLKRRKIEGIGNVKNLRPVPIPNGPAQ